MPSAFASKDEGARYRQEEILSAFEKMLALSVLSMEAPEIIENFLVSASTSRADLSDLLIGEFSKSNPCENTLTFDQKAARGNKLFKLME